MCEFNQFGATLQPLVRNAWQKRVEFFRTRQLSIVDAFSAVYAIYSECNEPIAQAAVDEFEGRLQSYAKNAEYQTKQQGDFIFCHRGETVRASVRIYINALGKEQRLGVARLLLKELQHLPKNGCEFKLLRNDDSRADNIVVYTSPDHIKTVKNKIKEIDWTGLLRSGVPAGTKKMLDGIGWAEQPGGEVGQYRDQVSELLRKTTSTPDSLSFGAVVSSCVVLGLKTAMPEGGPWNDESDKKRYCEEVIKQLKLVGMDPLKPHKAMRLDREFLFGKLKAYYKHEEGYDLDIGPMPESELRMLLKEALELQNDGKFG